MDVLKNKRILAIIGIACLFVGTITPYFQVSFLGYSYSISLWKYWEGKIIVVLIILNTMFIFRDFLQKDIPRVFNSNLGRKIENASPKLSIIPTILVVGFVIYLNTKSDFNSEYLKNGLGFYLLWLGVICLVAHAILYKKPTETQANVNQGYNNKNVNPQQNYQQPTQPQMQQPVQNSAINTKFCPNCGNQVDETATQCFMCGHKF